MRISVAMILCCLSIVGCVARQPRPSTPPAVVSTPTPVCEEKQQCEAMWIDAQTAISLATGMKIRLITDSRIETFAPRTFGYTGGVVTKYPIGGEKYEMRISISCYGHTECNDQRVRGTDLFNLHVAAFPPKK